jgi:hypothetical protein
MTQAEKNTVCAPAHRPVKGSKGRKINEKKKLVFTVYFDRKGKVTAIDVDCHSGCSDDCPVQNICDKITANLYAISFQNGR